MRQEERLEQDREIVENQVREDKRTIKVKEPVEVRETRANRLSPTAASIRQS